MVDILVNNAGIGMAGRFLETTPEHWDTVMAVNVRGVINGCRAFGARMVERGQGGTIINVASAAAFLPSKSMVAYGTTKAAVLALSESLRADLADEGITVTAVCPGFVNTNIAKSTVYAGMTAEQQQRAERRPMPRIGVATTPRKPPPKRLSRRSRPARRCCRSQPSPGWPTRCAGSVPRCFGSSPASTFDKPR
ncbi:short chain dehydrogenase family protein [Mycobacterium xenopi 3993]|nr:short chain dehydrogenase family protein [Mycobacterium xenopi 3993]